MATVAVAAASGVGACTAAPQTVATEGPRIVAKHQAVFTAPPKKCPSDCSTDAPLLGNGNLLAVMGGGPAALRFFISKHDLWCLSATVCNPAPLARMELDIDGMKEASYHVEQDLRRGITSGTFVKGGASLQVQTAVAATDNLLWVRLSATGGEFTGKAQLCVPGNLGEKPVASGQPDVQLVVRRFGGPKATRFAVQPLRPTRATPKASFFPTAAACALRVVSGNGAANGSFTVSPGKEVLLLVSATSLEEGKDYPARAVQKVAAFVAADLPAVQQAHEAWWCDFWGRSFVEIPDKQLEQRYYLANYCLASASRLADFAPGIYGWTMTDNPKWSGAYFLNYNFFAPFYSLYAANHIEQADPCSNAMINALATGRKYGTDQDAYRKGGVFLTVTIGPRGSHRQGAGSFRQRSNASYGCVALASRWYATYDLDFAKRAYPFVEGVATFWENWLKLEKGPDGRERYADYNDAVLELYGNLDKDCGQLNPLHTLALIRQVMDLAIDMSSALGVDADRRAKWADIRDRLSDYPTCTVRDLPPGSRVEIPKTEENLALPIFRYTEKGPAWQDLNAVGIQHIFPGNGIGLGTRTDLLERARNQIKVMARWIDICGCNSFYPAAVRVGYDPDEILKQLRNWVATASPNGERFDNPHGMEQFSVVPCTIQEMLMQGYDGTLRLFPNWPKNQDARFGTLRARGAFLVSAELKKGEVCGVCILSEKGRDLTVQNPWPGKKVCVTRNGKVEAASRRLANLDKSGETPLPRFTIKTAVNETLELKPE